MNKNNEFKKDIKNQLEQFGLTYIESIKGYRYMKEDENILIYVAPTKRKPVFSLDMTFKSLDPIAIRKQMNLARNISLKIANIIDSDYED